MGIEEEKEEEEVDLQEASRKRAVDRIQCELALDAVYVAVERPQI